MGMKRKTWNLHGKDVLYVEENHDGRYGAPGQKRTKRKKPTKEDMQKVNAWNKKKKAQMKLLQYFNSGDIFATLTYRPDERPPDMPGAVKDFGKMMDVIRREYKKRGKPLFWIRNIEQGTKGAWHIHMAISNAGDTAAILEKAWNHGGVYVSKIRNSSFYDQDFSKLAAYITKDEKTREKKKDGTSGKPRLRNASYNTSRNMPLPEPKKKKLKRWQEEPKPRKGYYIARIHEGINPVTGYKYRHYTMIRINRRI